MSRPAAGNYIIYNRVLSPAGEKLAITFHGENEFATVEPFEDDDTFNKIWIIQDFDANTQTVVPMNVTDLQAASNSQGVKVLKASDYVWSIRSGDEGYTIQDGAETVNWGVENGHAGEKVTITDDQGAARQRWIFEKQPQ